MGLKPWYLTSTIFAKIASSCSNLIRIINCSIANVSICLYPSLPVEWGAVVFLCWRAISPYKFSKNRTYKIHATSWVHELSRKHRNAFLYQCFVLLDASYALKVAQETIRSTLLQNEKKSRERLLFGVKKSGTIFFSNKKKIHPDGFTPKSNRSRRIFSFCKRVDRMVSWATLSA